MATTAIGLGRVDRMASNDSILQEIRSLRTDINNELKGLRVDLSKAATSIAALETNSATQTIAIRDLTVEMRRMDDQKASRPELTALESRFNQSVKDVRAEAEYAAGRIAGDLGKRIDMFEEQLKDFRDHDFKEMKSAVSWLRDKVWWVLGLGTGAWGLLEYFLHRKG